MNQVFTSESVEETEHFAFKLAKSVPSGTVIALYGDLGAGKTVFARGFARGLGITEVITSPTFTILQEYATPKNKRLCHFDLYRLSNYAAALDFGMDEYLADVDNYCLVEWPTRAIELFPDETLHITLSRDEKHNIDGNETRLITLLKKR